MLRSEAVIHVCPYTPAHIVLPDIGVDYQTGGIMVVGEAPGYYEDKLGRPFVGDSGRYLDALLSESGIPRSSCYVTNIVSCRPPANKLTAVGIKAHLPFFAAQLAEAAPSLVITIGAVALHYFDPTATLSTVHGKPITIGNLIIIPMYHPAAAMRNPRLWPVLHADFLALRSLPPAPPIADYVLGEPADVSPGTIVGFDVETTDTLVNGVFYPHLQRILGYSVSVSPGQATYTVGPPDDRMKAVLENPAITKVCHNAKFEYQVLKNHGITLRGIEDTKVLAYLMAHLSTHLKDLSLQVLNVKQMRLEEVTKGRPTADVLPEEWVRYAAADADLTRQLWFKLRPQVADAGMDYVYEQLELPLIPVLADAERRGVLIDVPHFEAVADQMRGEVVEMEKILNRWFPGVNLNSGVQVGEVVYGPDRWRCVVVKELKTRTHIRWIPPGLGLATPKATATGRPSVDKDALGKLRHEAVDVLLAHRHLTGLLENFVLKLPRLVLDDGAIHTSLNQAGTWEEAGEDTTESPATGRLSASKPNVMQTPKRDEKWAKEIRRGFRPRPGYVWVTADVSQEEPRLAAVVSEDEQLRLDFESGLDVYMPVAHLYKQALMKDVKATAVRGERDAWGLEYRDSAKNKAFLPVLYGSGVGKLMSLHPGLTNHGASAIIGYLHKRYPQLADYARRVERDVLEHGFNATMFGRRRWYPGVWVRQTRAESLRQAVNHPIQGTGADILKHILVDLFGVDGKLRAYDVHFLYPVHDSVELEVRVEQVKEVVEVLRGCTGWFTAITLPVEIETGESWGDVQPYTVLHCQHRI